jgi:hypothetical protein
VVPLLDWDRDQPDARDEEFLERERGTT